MLLFLLFFFSRSESEQITNEMKIYERKNQLNQKINQIWKTFIRGNVQLFDDTNIFPCYSHEDFSCNWCMLSLQNIANLGGFLLECPESRDWKMSFNAYIAQFSIIFFGYYRWHWFPISMFFAFQLQQAITVWQHVNLWPCK